MMLRVFLFFCFLFVGKTVASQPANDQNDASDPSVPLILSGQYDSALVIVNKLLEKDSLSFQQNIRKFEIYRNKNRRRSFYRHARHNFNSFFESVGELEKGMLLIHFCHAAFRRKKFEEAQTHLSKAENFLKTEGEKGKFLQAYTLLLKGNLQGHFHSMQDKNAETYFLEALQIFQKLGNPDPYLQGQTAKQLGIVYRLHADFEKALDYFEIEIKTYQQYTSESANYDLGGAFYNKANVYYELGDFQSALDHYLAAYEHWQAFMKPSDTYMRYLTETIGEMYWELGEQEKALPFFNLSVEGKERAANPNLEKPKIADSLLAENRYQEALDIYEDALSFRKKLYGEKHGLTGACQNFIAKAWLTKGEPQKALDAYQQAIRMLVIDFEDSLATANPTLSMQIISEQYLLESLAGKALTISELYRNSKKEEDLKLAFETTQRAIELLNRLRRSPLADRSKLFWTQKYFSLFENALELAYELFFDEKTEARLSEEEAEIIFQIMEESKTMLLQKAMRSEHELQFLNVPAEVLKEERALRKAINAYAVRIENEERLCEKASADKLEIWNKELLQQKLNYNLFQENIKKKYPNYFDLKFSGGAVDLKTVQQQLLEDSKTVLIEFFEGEKFIYTLLLTEEGSFFFQTENNSVFQKQLAAYSKLLYDVEGALHAPQAVFEQFHQQSFHIFEKIVKPLLSYVPAVAQHIYVVPDHHLFYLPFESLVMEKNENAKNDFRELSYLMNRFYLSYSQSATMLVASNFTQKTNYKFSYLGFAPSQFTDQLASLNPLNWNREEIKIVAEQWNGKPFEDASATKNQFIELAGEGQIQHLATHALIDNENPMSSKILFQKNEKEEGIMQTFELYALPMSAELVVLNACNTSVGKWERGEGMMSLERAFQFAGCPALLTSTWSIDDQATAELTNYFFDFLQEKKSKDEALTLAKRKFLEEADPALRHPFFWAGLRLTGNRNAIHPTATRQNIWWWLGGVFVLFFGIFIWKKFNSGVLK